MRIQTSVRVDDRFYEEDKKVLYAFGHPEAQRKKFTY